MRHQVAALAVAVPFLAGIVATPAAPPGQRIFRFHDPAIAEASAMVVQDGLFVTTNDSGDTGRVFAVDRTGATVGVTHWSDDPIDTEALAPAGAGHVWVGDIGDNEASRPFVDIAEIPVGRGDRTVHPTSYRLTYPDHAVNAETLVRNPVTGRLYVATKSTFGGVLYAVPRHLDASAPNRLEPVGRVLAIATDGAFFPDGRHLIVRNYTSATVYDWPSMQPVGSFDLPHERQGEGLGVDAGGAVYVSSEGPRQPVIRVRLPARIAAVVKPARPHRVVEDVARDAWPWVAGGLIGLAALVVLVRAVRPH